MPKTSDFLGFSEEKRAARAFSWMCPDDEARTQQPGEEPMKTQTSSSPRRIISNHNQTLFDAGRIIMNHNQTVVRR
jgi:hypothetical protein